MAVVDTSIVSFIAVVAIAVLLFCAFEWRDLRRRRSLARANRRIAVNSRFVELTNDLALTLDFDSHVIDCNNAWEDQLGLSLHDLQTEPFGSRLHPDDFGLVGAEYERVAEGGHTENTPLRFRHKDGTYRWLEWNAVPAPEEGLLFCSARDVTARIELQQTLEIERLQLRSAQEIARIGSWHLELETGEMYWSDATYALLAIKRPEGMPDAELWLSSLAPAEHDRATRRLAEAIKDGGEFSFDFRRAQLDRNGEEVFLATKGYAERGLDGKTTRLVGTIVDITERQRYQDGLKFIADHDPLTGLPNRRKFDEVLTRHVAQCERYGPRGAVLMIDLDKLKQVNDQLGHVAGDDMIKCMGDALRERLRDTDTGARIGGDEFAVLLTETTHQGARLVAQSIGEQLMESSPQLRHAGVQSITASTGIALIEDFSDLTPETLLTAADDAMYAAKRLGRGNIREHRRRDHLSSAA